MRIIVASDHVGLDLKKAVVEFLRSRQVTVFDAGPHDESSVDYPDYARLVGERVTSGEFDQGVLICGTGLGMSIAANKTRGIRAALCHDNYTAHQARAHNNANVLCMGAWVVSPQRVAFVLDEWLNTEFEHGRHTPRVIKLNEGGSRPEDAAPASGTAFALPDLKFGVALSPAETVFGPLLFQGNLEGGMRAAALAGLDVVELSLRSPGEPPVERIAALLAEQKLTLSAIATGQSCLHEGMCLASADSALRRASRDRIQAHIDSAASLGSALIIGGVRGKFSGSPAEQTAQRKHATELMRELGDYAAEKGVTLLIEAINRYETNFVNSAADALALIEEIGSTSYKVLLDTFHMNLEERDIPAAIRATGERLGYIHFVDSNRRAPGQGHLDFKAVLQALAEIHYRGPVVAEVLPLPDDLTAVEQAGAFFRQLRAQTQPQG